MDIVERLKSYPNAAKIEIEAADEITTLRAKLAEAERERDETFDNGPMGEDVNEILRAKLAELEKDCDAKDHVIQIQRAKLAEVEDQLSEAQAKLAEYEKQEPVGFARYPMIKPFPQSNFPAPRKEWQGLTEEEVNKLWAGCVKQYGHVAGLYKHDIARAIEAKLKEKNA